MKYKVGDKVRIREDLVMGENYGGSVAVDDMTDMCGSVVTIERVGEVHGYYIKEDPDEYCWTDEMFEPVEEMSAIEAIKLFGELCHEQDGCDECPIKKIDDAIRCYEIRTERPEAVVEVLKQWKSDHEKKPIETEFAWCVLIIEADNHTLKHEEKVETDIKSMDARKAEILKKYCSEHDGKYYAISERRCVVKE